MSVSLLDKLPDDALHVLCEHLTDNEIIGTLCLVSQTTRSSVLRILTDVLRERYPEQETRVALQALEALRYDFPDAWRRETSVSIVKSFSFGDTPGNHVQMAQKAAKICEQMLTKHNPRHFRNLVDFETGLVNCLNLSVTDGEGYPNHALTILMMERDAPHRDLEKIIRITYPAG